MLITDAYRSEQSFLHTNHARWYKYGTGGPQWAGLIAELMQETGCVSLLDYGCGKALLAKCMIADIDVRNYDPAVEAFAQPPEPVDFVACLDVLEHVEPDCLNAVVDHIAELTRRFLFVSVSLVPAGRTLRDGRNAHLIVKPAEWWLRRFETRKFAPVKTFRRKAVKHEWVALLVKP